MNVGRPVKSSKSERFCLYCKNVIERPLRPNSKFRISWSNYQKKIFCNITCKSRWRSENMLGDKNYNFKGGKTKCIDCGITLPYRYSWRKNSRCRKCWIKYAVKENHPGWKGGSKKCKLCGGKTGDHYSNLCRTCYCGENHPAWKGGITSLQSKIRTLPEYRNWIKSVFSRDNYTCKNCNISSKHTSNNLTAHHIKQFALILKENNIISISQAINCKELWDISNGQTLCKKCHKLTDSFSKKL